MIGTGISITPDDNIAAWNGQEVCVVGHWVECRGWRFPKEGEAGGPGKSFPGFSSFLAPEKQHRTTPVDPMHTSEQSVDIVLNETTCRIRFAQSEDAMALAELKVTCWQADYDGLLPQQALQQLDASTEAPHWQSWLEDSGSGLIACVAQAQDGSLLGYGLAGPMRLGDRPDQELADDGELYALHVHPDWQRRGLARSMLAKLVAAMVVQEHNSMGHWMIGGNHKAEAFLAAMKAREAQKRVEIRSGRIAFREKSWSWPDLKALQARLTVRPV